MTNKDILQADVLDILFENRNKAYGAYALRKTYDKRLLAALGAGLGIASLLLLFSTMKREDKTVMLTDKKEGLVVREYVIPQRKIEPPVQPKQPVKQKPVVKTAQVKYTSKIDIKKDELVKSPVTSVDNLADKRIGDTDIKGKPDDGVVKRPEGPDTGTGNDNPVITAGPDPFAARETAPEFPGGPGALHRFLSKNLNTPGDLGAGEQKLVKVRFKVDTDGSVTGLEIVESGGREFDNEVLRVVKKMPRWTPAFQNGIHVPVSYMIPVTFIGLE